MFSFDPNKMELPLCWIFMLGVITACIIFGSIILAFGDESLQEFNKFVANLNSQGIEYIYWLDVEGADLLHTDNPVHYGWKDTDKEGWYLRIPISKGSMWFDLYPCPLREQDLFDTRISDFIDTWYLKRYKGVR